MAYEPIIGLEIHAELRTSTKMFCPCLNEFDEKHPNVNVCPICTGHPGVLPTANKKAVELVLKLGMALGGDIPISAKFDRKNYFYPDLPKSYQISQYDMPLVFGGILKGVHIRRLHLEEDAGKLLHSDENESLVDFNRAGVPLMELVTEPEIKSAEEAVEFTKELQLILRYLNVSDADMEKGQLRLEANISIRKATRDSDAVQSGEFGQVSVPRESVLGTKVEVKNLNSFKALHDAIEYEIKRQAELLDNGEKVVQETRGWDDVKKITVLQRLKEEAFDYRYFPEPDLPPLDLSLIDLPRIKAEILELPFQKRQRFIKEYKLTAEQADSLTSDLAWADYFEKSVSELLAAGGNEKGIGLLFNYLMTDLRGLLKAAFLNLDELKFGPANFADLINLVEQNKLTSRLAKDILKKMIETGLDAHQIMRQENINLIVNKNEIEEMVREIIKQNPKAIEDYKKGKSASVQFLVGQGMKSLRGQGDPNVLREVFEKLLAQ